MGSEETSPRQWIVIAALLIATLLGRVTFSGLSALEEGQRALELGDEVSMTIALREAVSWYLPFAPWRSEAITLLWELHERQLTEARLADAVRTLQSLRSGLWAADSLIRPNLEDKARVDKALASLMARWEQAVATQEGRKIESTLAKREAYHARLLAADERPKRGWGILVVIGVIGFGWSVYRGIASPSAQRRRWLGLAVICVFCVLLGVSQA